ncbi:MAG: hypothetical protein CVU84_15570 [Firmicutes bacterium HGW-Firmicutes-1]|jgi:hypothetical protein|nr:MAG: hypothetical protein CVU84_15570 [Firmicutes bacterium HGW-Firmicutes-1]
METIIKRISTRNYLDEELDQHEQELVKNIIDLENSAIFGHTFEVKLVDQKFMKKNKVKRIGTYGVITGKPNYMFAGIENDNQSLIDYGFVLEKMVLDLTEKDLQTCWLGGSFSRRTLFKLYKLSNELFIPAVVAIGKKSEKKSFVQNLMGSNYHNRMRFEEIYYDNKPYAPLNALTAGEYFEPLEAMRMAPSAMNGQPWRAVLEGDKLHFYCETTNMIKMKYVDMGIGFSHFDRLCTQKNIEGRWQLLDIPSTSKLQYIISYVK